MRRADRPTAEDKKKFATLADAVHRHNQEEHMGKNRNVAPAPTVAPAPPRNPAPTLPARFAGSKTAETGFRKRNIDGYVEWAEGVVVEGIAVAAWTWRDGHNQERRTMCVRLDRETHGLYITNPDDEEIEAKLGMTVGFDVKYDLQNLANIVDAAGEDNTLVFIVCDGKIDIKGGKTKWEFTAHYVIIDPTKVKSEDNVPF